MVKSKFFSSSENLEKRYKGKEVNKRIRAQQRFIYLGILHMILGNCKRMLEIAKKYYIFDNGELGFIRNLKNLVFTEIKRNRKHTELIKEVEEHYINKNSQNNGLNEKLSSFQSRVYSDRYVIYYFYDVVDK